MARPLLDLNASRLSLMGKPVRISPSMDSIAASENPIAFGDLSYWVTRYAPNQSYLLRYQEVPGLIEKGLVGVRAFARFDGALLWKQDQVSNPPVRLLKNSS